MFLRMVGEYGASFHKTNVIIVTLHRCVQFLCAMWGSYVYVNNPNDLHTFTLFSERCPWTPFHKTAYKRHFCVRSLAKQALRFCKFESKCDRTFDLLRRTDPEQSFAKLLRKFSLAI